MRVAIIGTAGRDRNRIMTRATWDWMVSSAMNCIPAGSHVVSGGAAWADHVAVRLFMDGHASALTLHLPSHMNDSGFIGPYQSAGSAANYYHERFSRAIGENTIQQLLECITHDACTGSAQQPAPGYSAMFTRNKLVVNELDTEHDGMVAFTFGQGNEPADGGTNHTWGLFRGHDKLHLTIPDFA